MRGDAETTPSASFDPIDLEIQWNRLVTVMDETDFAVVRTSFSTIVGESRDFACILLDPRGKSLAQSTFSTPNFTVTLPITVKAFLRKFPLETLVEGDVLITNDPWIASGHLPDLSIATPVFHRGKVVAFVGTVAHVADIGGKLGYFSATQVFEEGLRLPPAKLVKAGALNEVIFDILAANVRVPEMVIGDVHAIIGAQRIGARRLVEFLEDYDLPDLDALAAVIHERSATAMRRAILDIPDGDYAHAIMIDGYKTPVRIACRIEVRGDSLLVDYTGTSPQSTEGAINVVPAAAWAATLFPLKCSLTPAIPNNEGLFSPIRVFAPEGSILNAKFPVAVRSRSKVSFHIHSAIYGALAGVIPDRVQAGSGSFWSFTAYGQDDDGTRCSVQFLPWGGKGAPGGMDGLSTTAFPLNGTATPAEVVENLSPLLLRRRELLVDSGGAGEFRGGLGQRVVVGSTSDRPMTVAVRPDKLRYPPGGVLGGHDAPPGRCTVNGQPADLDEPFELRRGDELVMEVPGGAGFGPPERRDRDRVLADLREGLISPARAAADYGVSAAGDG